MASGSFIYGYPEFTETPPQWFVNESLRPIGNEGYNYPIKSKDGYITHRVGNKVTMWDDAEINYKIKRDWQMLHIAIAKSVGYDFLNTVKTDKQ